MQNHREEEEGGREGVWFTWVLMTRMESSLVMGLGILSGLVVGLLFEEQRFGLVEGLFDERGV